MRFSIKYQILLIAMIPVFLIDVFFTYVHVNNSIKQAEQLLASKGEIIAQQIAGASEFSLLSGNFEQIQHILEQSINTNNIIFIAVYNSEGTILAQVKSPLYHSELTAEYSYYRQSIYTQNIESEDIFQPYIEDNILPLRHLGWVHMYISKHQLQQNKIKIFYEGALFFCAMLLVAIVLTMLISRRLTQPIYRLLTNLKQIETGQLGFIIEHVENNEIGDVQKGFNSMSQALLANQMQLDQKIKTATLELMNAITNLEYNNKELAIARDDAQKADQVKSQFLANMSHEIRTPINGIKGFINLLSNSGLNPDQLRYANIINQSTSDLSNIVNEILDFSKIESGKIELLESQFDLYELVETTRDSLYASTLEKNIDLFLTIYSDTPHLLYGDVMRLKQILVNLIGNAIKFTDEGFVAITVLVEDESEDQVMIKFNIEDSGIGISEENQKSLFKAFKQIESDTNRRFSGTGLGLVISKNLATLMGGDIILKSQVGSGSLFSLYIPFKLAVEMNSEAENSLDQAKTVMIIASNPYALNELQSLFNRIHFNTETLLIDNNISAAELKVQLEQNLNYIDKIAIDLRHSKCSPDQFISLKIKQHCEVIVMHYDLSMVKNTEYRFISVINTSSNLATLLNSKNTRIVELKTETGIIETANSRHILIVDDNSINLAFACELTRLWGHKSEQANNARKAMQLFNKHKFDLIFLDIQMPEVDGIELMFLMRKAQPEMTTPIVAITANVLDKEKERLLNLGFDAYISKPIDEAKLKRLLEHRDPEELSLTVHSNEVTEDQSIDYDLTYSLSANNKKLADSSFSMLKLEIPDYIQEIESAIRSSDIKNILSIVHKLRGISCYVGLPLLKSLLIKFESVKQLPSDEKYEISKRIIDELKNINKALEDHDFNEVV